MVNTTRRKQIIMYIYETHVHTSPVSLCASATVRQTVEFYKNAGYSGLFITNHFIDGNIGTDRSRPEAQKLDFYYSDYYEARAIGEEIGIDVFLGIEMTYGGTDFLVYGIPPEFFKENPGFVEKRKSEQLKILIDEGALVVQAHPFREASYIDHIRLFPRHVHAIEVINANRTDFENKMASLYAEYYSLLTFAGSDNHVGENQKVLAGLSFDTKIKDEKHFVELVKLGKHSIFRNMREETCK